MGKVRLDGTVKCVDLTFRTSCGIINLIICEVNDRVDFWHSTVIERLFTLARLQGRKDGKVGRVSVA